VLVGALVKHFGLFLHIPRILLGGSFTDTVSRSEHVASNGLGIKCNEPVLAEFEVKALHLSEGTEDNRKKNDRRAEI
jgi:CO/xanthine dehydrogenase FAD-binding subunit